MNDPLLSPSWYRVAQLRPRLRDHVRFHRHRYRGQRWYVLQDPGSGRSHRLRSAAWFAVGLMNGARTTHEIWETACAELDDEAPSQDEMLRLLGMLHGADVLRCDVSPDTAELLRRTQRRERSQWWRRYTQPLSIRVPLVDPDAFLERALPFVRPLFSRAAAVAAAVLVCVAGLLAAAHGPELTANAAERLLAPGNLPILLLAYPLLKALHELGHAFAVKRWGGEVHELGVLFLVFFPVPYVDASAATAFSDKGKRVAVGAAGIGVELVIAALALFVWLLVEPGGLRSLAFDLMWIGGVSTLLFNGNPLLRFDGYYVLSDWIEIPNLRARSSQYFAHLVQRHGFGLENVRNPVTARGERAWFVVWGLASTLYRIAIVFAIALFVAERFFSVGVLMAVAALAMQIAAPLLRQARFVLRSPRLGERRPRALAASALALSAFLGLTLLLPLPLSTRAQGVVWPPDGTHVRAGAEGFVEEVLVAPGDRVEPGQPLLRTRDASLEAELAVREARVRELRARHRAARRSRRVLSQNLRDELSAAEAARARARERADAAVIRSPAAGRFVAPRAHEWGGRFVRQGEMLGYVVGPSISTARVVIPQESAALVQERTRGVALRHSRRPGEVVTARVLREIPAATHRLPSAALGSTGGGPFAIDPTDSQGLRTTRSVFQLELEFPPSSAVPEIGGRVHVRFDHGAEPIAGRGYRALRRVLLSRLGV